MTVRSVVMSALAFSILGAACLAGETLTGTKGTFAGRLLVNVPAATPRVRTRLKLERGESFSVTAYGSWRESRASRTAVGPDGKLQFLAGNPFPGARSMSLCGRIGTGPAFLIGSRFRGTANAGGEIVLFCNDASHADNIGSVAATIVFRPSARDAIVDVSAATSGTDTNLRLKRGQVFTVFAHGSWKGGGKGQGACGPNGEKGKFDAANPLPRTPNMALCARVGGGQAFFVGTVYAGVANADGELVLFCNDADCKGNTGSMAATVNVSP